MPALFPITGSSIGASAPPPPPPLPPAPTVISTASSSVYATAVAARVYHSATLDGVWVQIEHCYCASLRMTVAPAIDQATLLWEYGIKLQSGEAAFEAVAPLDVEGEFIKIEFDDWWNNPSVAPITWYGIAEGDTLKPHGKVTDPLVDPAAKSSGKQTITVYGLLRLLERDQIETSVVSDKDETFAVTIGKGLTFNLDDRGHFTARGNRSTAADIGVPFGSLTRTYIFSHRERGMNEWTAEQAVKHILEHHAPFLDGITWDLDIGSGSLDWNPKAVATDRRTPKQVLDELIARHRGVGYRVEFDGTDTIEIKVFSLADIAISMPNGTTFAANPDQYSLDFETAFDIETCTVSNLKTTQYHKIVIEGDWRTCTLTMRAAIGMDELVADWSSTEESAFFLAASHETWYAALNQKDKVVANKAARQDDRFRHVFERFKISESWSKETADPENVLSFTTALPVVDLHNAHPTTFPWPVDVCLPRLQILDHLPLRERYDYSDDHISDEDWEDTAVVSDDPPFREPFAFMATGLFTFSDAQSWELLDKIDGDAFEAPDKRKWSINTRAHHDRAAISLNVQGGPQQYFATSVWSEDGSNDLGNWNASTNTPTLTSGTGTAGDYYTVDTAGTTDLDGIDDWQAGDRLFFNGTRWRRSHANVASDHTEIPKKNHGLDYYNSWVTLTVELPERTRIERIISLPADGELERVLRVPVQDCRLDYVVPNTVVGIKDATLQISRGGFVRDDTAKLAALARAAELWYGKNRQTLDLTYRQLREIVKLGWLITDISSTYKKIGINSVVSAITYDFLQQTTQFETAYAEMDLIA